MNDMTRVQNWGEAAQGLSEASLRALMAGDVPAIRIADFATKQECAAYCDGVRAMAARGKEAQTSRMTLLGANFSNYVGDTKQGYFDTVDESYAITSHLAEQAGFDPLERILALLQEIWPNQVGVAEEPGFGHYFAGGVKTRAASGHLHYDFTPHTAHGYVIAGITEQLGWNLYLEMPTGTGDTTTYHRAVPREGGAAGGGPARVMNLDANYVEGAESFTFNPKVGEVIVINTRNPHDIIVENVRPGEWRAQASSFIGRLPDDALIMWS